MIRYRRQTHMRIRSMSGESSLPAIDLESSSAGSHSPRSSQVAAITTSLPQLTSPRHGKKKPFYVSTSSGESATPAKEVSVISRVKSSLSSSRYTTGRYFQKDISIVCYRCSKVGHRAEECQEEDANPVERPCYLCARTTHLAKDCTYQICKDCGRRGHVQDACVADVALKASPETVGLYAESTLKRFSFVSVKCMTCKGYGHLTCAGTEPRYKKVYLCANDTQDVEIYCANCGQAGHIYAACKRPRVASFLGRDYYDDFVKCFSCNTYGHVGRRCPTQALAEQPYRTFAAPPSPYNQYPHYSPRAQFQPMPVTRQIIPPRAPTIYRQNYRGPPRHSHRFQPRHSRFVRTHLYRQRNLDNSQQCSNCSGYGHSASRCPSLPRQGPPRFSKRRRYH